MGDSLSHLDNLLTVNMYQQMAECTPKTRRGNANILLTGGLQEKM